MRYSNMGNEDRGALLKRACDLILSDPTLRPEYDKSGKLLKTYCNVGVRLVAQALDCHDLDDPNATADVMLGLIKENMSGKWRRGDGREAVIHALTGGLAVAGLTSAELDEEHGHIAPIYPVGMQYSNALGHDVPLVANIGPGDPAAPLLNVEGRKGIKTRDNWLCTAAWAFPCKRLGHEPDYFLWT